MKIKEKNRKKDIWFEIDEPDLCINAYTLG